MSFRLEIETDNAAFHENGGPGVEVARILRLTAKRLTDWTPTADPPPVGGCYDLNGNRVGSFELTLDDGGEER